MYNKRLIVNYEVNDTSVRIDLIGGGSYLYAPAIEGYDAGSGAVPTLKVATYQPCISSYTNISADLLQGVDNGASMIALSLDAYMFDSRGSNDDSDYNDGEVNVNECAQFGKYNVVLWHGHGVYDKKYGSLLLIGIERNDENDSKYSDAILSGDMMYTKSGYLISSTFIDKYVADNSIVYLGTCSSGKDEKLAQAFINKGAEAVYVNSNKIHTEYNLRMINSVAEGLCRQYDDGTYYTVEDALEYAKSRNGERDWTGAFRSAEVELITQNNNFALDWYIDRTTAERDVVIVLDTSGSMSGDPISETKQAAEKFVKTTLKEDAVIGVVTYSNTAVMESDFTRKENALTNVIAEINTGGGTNIDTALQKADEMLSGSNAAKKIIVLMSDGEPNVGRQGTMNYTVGFMDEKGNYSDFRNFENINITKNSEIDATANSGDKTRLKIDENGDGRYEQEYIAGPNEKGKVVSKAPIYFGIFIICIALLTAGISFIILLVQLRRRKKLRMYYGF